MHKVPSPARLIDPRIPCAIWCHTHDDEAGVCLGNSIDLDFDTDGRPGWLTSGAGVLLARSIEDGTDVTLSFDGRGAQAMTIEDAEQLAQALLQAVKLAKADAAVKARGKSPCLPAPRTSADNADKPAGGAK